MESKKRGRKPLESASTTVMVSLPQDLMDRVMRQSLMTPRFNYSLQDCIRECMDKVLPFPPECGDRG